MSAMIDDLKDHGVDKCDERVMKFFFNNYVN